MKKVVMLLALMNVIGCTVPLVAQEGSVSQESMLQEEQTDIVEKEKCPAGPFIRAVKKHPFLAALLAVVPVALLGYRWYRLGQENAELAMWRVQLVGMYKTCEDRLVDSDAKVQKLTHEIESVHGRVHKLETFINGEFAKINAQYGLLPQPAKPH